MSTSSTPAPAPSPFSNDPTVLRPQFWVLRPQTNTMVPLIAVDELPPTISIRGVPRSLEARDLTGMTCVGPADSRHATYIVDMPRDNPLPAPTPPQILTPTLASTSAVPATAGLGTNVADRTTTTPTPTSSPPPRRGLHDSVFATPSPVVGFGFPLPNRPPRPLATTNTNKTSTTSTDTASGNQSIFPQPPKAYGISEQMPSHIKSHITGNIVPLVGFPTDTTTAKSASAPLPPPQRLDRNPGLNPTSTTTSLSHPHPLPPWQDATSIPLKAAPGIKEYCSFWLRYGECDYAQQGCLYKHEMPLDRAVLERLGHRDIPRWYREKHGLGSFLAATGGGGVNTAVVTASSEEKGGEDGEELEGDSEEGPMFGWESDVVPGSSPGPGATAGAGGRRVKRGLGSSSTAAVASSSSSSRITARMSEKKVSHWRDEWEKKSDGRFAPKGSSGKKIAAAAVTPSAQSTSLIDTDISPVKFSVGGPGRRSLMAEAADSSSSTGECGHNNGAYYRSAIARKVDEATVAALAAEEYAKKAQGKEKLKGLESDEILEPKRRSVNNLTQVQAQTQEAFTPPMTGSSGSSGDESFGDGAESEWAEGDIGVQQAAIARDMAGLKVGEDK